jgi:FAD/FMN-containing dehydrogenase
MIMDQSSLVSELRGLLTGDISTLEADLEKASRDTSLFYVRPQIVVFPKDKDDLIRLVRFVHEKKAGGMDVSLTMRAAGTCMTGGPLSTSIVADTTRHMNHVLSIDTSKATVEPGMFYRDFEKETLAHGWLLPSYPASRELAALGGIVSNNSGGEKTLTYGKTEKYVEALDVIFANGETDTLHALSGGGLAAKIAEPTESGRIHKEILALVHDNYDLLQSAKPSVSKNSSGYYLWNAYDKMTDTLDLSKLVVGSQGTLAAVAAATIKGVKPMTHSRMVVMFVPSTTHLGEIIPAFLKHSPETLESYDDNTFKIAIKFFKDIALRMGGNMISLGFQFLPEFWMALTGGVPKIILMAEFAGDSEDEVEKRAYEAFEEMKGFNLPLKMTHSAQEAKKYWTFRRESFNLLRSRLKGFRTAPTIDDIVVHPKDLPEFLPKLEAIFKKYPELIYTVAGHMGDANFHIIPLIDIHKEGIVATLHKLMDEVFALVFEYRGSMSGEHNDGLLRTAYLPQMYHAEVIKLFEKTKDIFDPLGMLNPGKKVYGDKAFAWSHIDTK